MLASWAVLLCKFNDDSTEPKARSFYDQLFTATGGGTQNMVDFFRDNSHGNADISGSQVFGWFTLPHPFSDYTGSGPNPAGRNQLVQWARDAATAAGANLNGFFKVCVVMNVETDLFGGAVGAVCSPNSTVPSLLGQEMGHGFGLAHSRIDGSAVDYMDPWDVMSTSGPYEAPHLVYGWIGPGLNAANMDGRGWLDTSRVWTGSSGTVQLRPLHRRDLPGWLCARVGPFYIEFRVRGGWDANIPQAVVLIHRFEDNRSYLMRGTGGQSSLGAGAVFEQGDRRFPWSDWLSIEVAEIDTKGDVATINVATRPAKRLPVAGPGRVFGGATRGGDGWIVINGHVLRVPPRSPVFAVLEQLATLQASQAIERAAPRTMVSQAIYASIAESVGSHLEDPGELETPPNRQDHGRFEGFDRG